MIISKIRKVSLYYRDDIVFRIYVLKTGNKKAWREFCRIPANRKVSYKKLYKFYRSIRKFGQIKPIRAVIINNVVYPSSGATRLGCMISIGVNKVKIDKISSRTKQWKDTKTLRTHHFKGMKEQTLIEFKKFANSIGQSLSESEDYKTANGF